MSLSESSQSALAARCAWGKQQLARYKEEERIAERQLIDMRLARQAVEREISEIEKDLAAQSNQPKPRDKDDD